jgi:hypothetical protein
MQCLGLGFQEHRQSNLLVPSTLVQETLNRWKIKQFCLVIVFCTPPWTSDHWQQVSIHGLNNVCKLQFLYTIFHHIPS